MKPPGLEPRRFSDFERELLDRARTWIPSWGLADGERDFGRALLEVAARFNSEVAERLDQVGDKMARGFLDWLAVGGEAARPARMPVAFQLADTARAPVDAPHPVRMQVDALGTNVSFETETDIRLVPGRLQLVVGVDPVKDELFLPPLGLSDLGPLELLPTRWQLKSFAGPGSSLLQLDPGAGLKEGMLLEIGGQQYAIAAVKDDLATIDPAVPAGNGFEAGTVVTKVDTFNPFERARNVQSHVLYLGHADLLNIEAQATIDIIGLPPLGPGASWEYWGKDAAAPPADADPRWRALTTLPPDPKKPGALLLQKPKGAIEPRKVGTAQSRWLRARSASLGGNPDPLSVDDITLRINFVPSNNPPDGPAVIPDQTPPDQAVLPPVDAIVNTMPQTPRDFYPLGREPRMFDTLYVGCAEAFSKKGATALAHFDLAEPSFTAMSAIDAGLIGIVVAGVDKAGALHLLAVSPDLTLVRLRGREPLRPGDGASGPVAKLSSRELRPVMWMVGNDLHVAVVAGSDVWVWVENQAGSSSSKWEALDAPASASNPPSPVQGLVPISDSGTINLVALRDGKLSMRPAVGGSAWTPLTGQVAALNIIDSIARVGHEDPTRAVSDYLLAVVRSPPSDHVLYAIKADGTASRLLQTDFIAPDVAPCAIEYSTRLEAAAASNSSPRTLLADTGTGATVTGDLEAGRALADTALDAQLRDGQFVAYGVAKADPGPGPSQLVTWMPFDSGTALPIPLPARKSIVFGATNDPSIGSPAGSVTVLTPTFYLPNLKLAYTPGNKAGEVLMAEFGALQSRRSAAQGDFRSVLAVRHPAPAPGDTIAAVEDATGLPVPAIVAAPAGGVDGLGDFSNQRFLWLEQRLERSTANGSFPEYATSALAVYTGTVSSPTTLTLDGADTTTAADVWLLVADGAPGTTARQVVKVASVAAGVATLDAATPLLPAVNTPVSYWLPRSTISGNIFPALQLTGANNTWGIDALSRGDIYFPALDPVHQHVIAVGPMATQPNNAEWLAFGAAWAAPIPAGNINFIVDGAITRWLRVLGDSSSNPTLSWEYWNGTGWWHLDIKDETHHLKNSGAVSFKVPTDLQPVDWAGKTTHWIRARLIGGDYGREKVTVKTTPTATGTEQVVERSTEGIQPPYALNIWVSYSVDEPVYPTFLLTLDSGTLRDQSDANRTPQAMIEVFTPLISTLQRLASPAGAAPDATAQCVPACACPSGSASTVHASNPAPPTAATGGQAPASRAASRALFLGFDKKLSGEPVNVLLVVGTERVNDSFAPLCVDALVGGHFVPVVAQDNTRAIGETGIVSMSFSVEPTLAELFGRTLSWLRLAPASAAGEWTPTLRGVYLNAVWARAAETMTRELVGSSEGAPLLTLQLARPPLLKDSLELRVKEPLGAEERDALARDDPDKVKSNVTDLPGDWVLWMQVADPADHEAGERVYSLDEDTGVIRFGDGQHGAIPPIGPDSIVAFRYERTEPAVAGEVPANFVNVRSPLNLVTPVEGAEAVIAADQSAGGVAPESVESVLHFGSARLRHRGRAVTARDFEDLACERFADIVQARCTLRGGNVRFVVVMRGADPAPGRAQRRELSSLLLAAAPAALAGKLVIEGPRVRRLRIELTLRVANLDVAGELARSAKQTLQTFFDTDTGGSSGTGWALGASPTEDDVAEALLDAPHLESIVSVSLSEIDAIGIARQWPQQIGSNDLALLAADGIRISFEIAEVAA